MRSLSVVVPAYNEQHRIEPTVWRLHQFLTARGYDQEIIVVDDGSRDATPEILTRLRGDVAQLQVIRHEQNSGRDHAVISGMRAASRDATLFMDADLPVPMEDLDRLWEWYDRGYEVAIGSRRCPGARVVVPHPLHRRLASRLFGMMVSVFVLRGFQDTQCGFKLFKTRAAQKVIAALRTKGFAFDVELLLRARELGFKIAEVGVRWSAVPGSRMRVFKHGTNMLLHLMRMKGLV